MRIRGEEAFETRQEDGIWRGGRPFKLELRDRLLVLLVYYKLYIMLAFMQFLFDLDPSNVWRDIRYLEPIVRDYIPLPKKIHDQVKRSIVRKLYGIYRSNACYLQQILSAHGYKINHNRIHRILVQEGFALIEEVDKV